jgi:uncharacterized membrane protein YjjP (DUF1212 family)
VSRELSHQELADILRVAVRVGVMMLQSGAASFRADQTICRVALAMGVEHVDAYVTPTVIVATVFSGREHRTQIAKPSGLGVNMDRIAALEHLSRNMPTPALPGEMMRCLDEIEHQPPQYARPLVVLSVALACGAFAAIIGGGTIEMLAAAVGAGAAQTVRFRLIAARVNPIPVTVVCAAVATAISLLLVRVMNAPLPRLGVIASVLLLVPGVPFITAILDMIRFDLVSGLSRGLHAGLLLISIGVGMLLVLALTGFDIL